jgi:hypothetical protein
MATSTIFIYPRSSRATSSFPCLDSHPAHVQDPIHPLWTHRMPTVPSPRISIPILFDAGTSFCVYAAVALAYMRLLGADYQQGSPHLVVLLQRHIVLLTQ